MNQEEVHDLYAVQPLNVNSLVLLIEEIMKALLVMYIEQPLQCILCPLCCSAASKTIHTTLVHSI